MESNLQTISNEADFTSFCALLNSSGLPVIDLDFKKDLLIGYTEDGVMVGTGGLEIYGEYGLLRSLSVKLGTRGKALGTAITEYIIQQARKRNLKGIYLLTETAHGFFLRKGFIDIAREEVPEPLKASSEFSYVCGASAVAMELQLK